MRVACERAFGTAALAGRTVAVVGLGHVGGRLAGLLAAGGAELRRLRHRPGQARARGGARRALDEPADGARRRRSTCYAPCALGGVLDHDTVPELRCRVVAGAANNQLADDDVAELLAARGVLWVPDFVANAGGIINIAVELEPEGYDRDRADARVRGDRRHAADRSSTTPRRLGQTPLTAAMELARGGWGTRPVSAELVAGTRW